MTRTTAARTEAQSRRLPVRCCFRVFEAVDDCRFAGWPFADRLVFVDRFAGREAPALVERAACRDTPLDGRAD